MRRFGIGVLCGIAGCVVAAAASYFLVLQFSGNAHDRSVEAAMTSVFFYGPAGGLIAFVIGVVRGGRRPQAGRDDRQPGAS